MSISAEVKRAFNIVKACHPKENKYNREIVVMLDAYVEAEWRRQKAEWRLDHEEYSCNAGVCCSECGQSTNWDERHEWTDFQWRAEVEKELSL